MQSSFVHDHCLMILAFSKHFEAFSGFFFSSNNTAQRTSLFNQRHMSDDVGCKTAQSFRSSSPLTQQLYQNKVLWSPHFKTPNQHLRATIQFLYKLVLTKIMWIEAK